jgi:D-ribulokinase
MSQRVYLGVDVGTGSVRAGVFDASGRMLGVGVEPIATNRPAQDFVEQSSDSIWRRFQSSMGLRVRLPVLV